MYPEGLNVSASDEETNLSFRPTPNYAALAEAAAGSEGGGGGGDNWGNNTKNGTGTTEGWMKGVRVRTVKEFKGALEHANSRVAEQGKGVLIEVQM